MLNPMRLWPLPRKWRNRLRSDVYALALLFTLGVVPCSVNGQDLVLHMFVAKEPTPKIEDLCFGSVKDLSHFR